MIFGGLQKLSTIDFPGNLCCVLFVRGCDLDCFYCHNRALLKSGGPVFATEDVYAFLEKRRGLLDGVVVSGGEPSLQKDLEAFLAELKRMGYNTKLDTNGQNTALIIELAKKGLADYIAVDIKAARGDYGWVTRGADGYERVMHTVEGLIKINANFEARVTLYPGMDEAALAKLLSAIPQMPMLRLNLFKMPQEYKKEDALLLRRGALSEQALLKALPSLSAIQPNITL